MSVWHKDGALAQVRAMADWADGMAIPAHNAWWETARKIARNLRSAAAELERPEWERFCALRDRLHAIAMAEEVPHGD